MSQRRLFAVLAVVAALLPLLVGLILSGSVPELFGTVFSAGWSALPFVHVVITTPALRRPRRSAAAAMAVTIGYWLGAIWSARYSHEHGTGADIGLGCIFFVLPLIVGAVVLVVDRWSPRPPATTS